MPPDLTITISRSDPETVMIGKATLDDLVANGNAKFDGDRKPLDQLRGMLVQFAPDFEMMPGTKSTEAAAMPTANDPFEQADLGPSDGG